MTVKVSEKGWIVIPAELRKKHNLHPGTEVQVADYGGVLALVPKLVDPAHQAAGILKGGASLRRALLAEHRAERRRGRGVAINPSVYALDGFALLAYLEGDLAKPRVKELLRGAESGSHALRLSLINRGEV